MEEPQEPRLGPRASQDLGPPREPEEVAEGALGRAGTATHLLLLETCQVPAVVESHLLPFPVLHEGGSCGMVGSSQGHSLSTLDNTVMPLAERRPKIHKLTGSTLSLTLPGHCFSTLQMRKLRPVQILAKVTQPGREALAGKSRSLVILLIVFRDPRARVCVLEGGLARHSH